MINESAQLKPFDHTAIFRSKAYNEAMNYFDNTDRLTRNILLAVNEAEQPAVMVALANKLYKHITDKVEDIDFGSIPASRGDITKIENYDNLMDCISVIKDVLTEYRQDTSNTIDVVATAVENVIDRKEMFVKAYTLNVEMPIVIYNTIVLSIVKSVEFLTATCIEFIKISDTEGFNIAVDKTASRKSSEYLLLEDLAKINKLCANGEFDKAMDFIIKGNSNAFAGTAAMIGVSSVAAIIGILLIIIPLIREMIFLHYYTRARFSNYFDAQSALLTMNAYNIENNLVRVEGNKKEIVKKQKKVAETFAKISNAIKIKEKKGAADAKKEITKLDSEKYKASEVLDSIPDSANATLF